MPYFSNDDIVQIATPPGPSPVGAIRLSGENVYAILAGLAPGLAALRTRPVTRGAHDGLLTVKLMPYRPGGRRMEARLVPARFFLMPAPASYTREDTAEVHLPGSTALLAAAMRTIASAGARPAEAGEFTFRAFRNGRLSLAQAEAVEEVVRAGTDAARGRALARLGGGARERAREWRDRLLDLAAGLEVSLDFPGEDAGQADAASALAQLAGEITASGAAGLAASGGRLERGLPHAALVGLANAGKSSLFNALLTGKSSLFNALLSGGVDAQERDGPDGRPGGVGSLVSPEASTTRDSLRSEAAWHGIRLILSDNPGYHPDGTGAAGAAAARGWRGLGDENAVVWVIDASVPLGGKETVFAGGLAGAAPGGALIVLNKCDLPPLVTPEEAKDVAARAGLAVRGVVEAVSSVTGMGLPALRRAVAEALEAAAPADGASSRERAELAAALAACRAAERELLGGGRLEIAAEEVRRAQRAFSLALGEGYAEEALARIFSTFCVGK